MVSGRSFYPKMFAYYLKMDETIRVAPKWNKDKVRLDLIYFLKTSGQARFFFIDFALTLTFPFQYLRFSVHIWP